jgi:hypothetical protein
VTGTPAARRLGVEGDEGEGGAAGAAYPDFDGLGLAIGAVELRVGVDLVLGVLGPGEGGGERAVGAGRDEHREADRGGEDLALLGERLGVAAFVAFVVVSRRELVVGGGIVDDPAGFGGEEAGEVPARGRELEDLRGVRGAGEGADEVRLERGDEVVADGFAGGGCGGGFAHGAAGAGTLPRARRCGGDPHAA